MSLQESEDLGFDKYLEANAVSPGDKIIKWGDEDDEHSSALSLRRKEAFLTSGNFVGYYTNINNGNVISGRLNLATQPNEIFLDGQYRGNSRLPFLFGIDPFQVAFKFKSTAKSEMSGMDLDYDNDYDKLAYAIKEEVSCIVDDDTWSYLYLVEPGIAGYYSEGHTTRPYPHCDPVTGIPMFTSKGIEATDGGYGNETITAKPRFPSSDSYYPEIDITKKKGEDPLHESAPGDVIPHIVYTIRKVYHKVRLFKPCAGVDPGVSAAKQLEAQLTGAYSSRSSERSGGIV